MKMNTFTVSAIAFQVEGHQLMHALSRIGASAHRMTLKIDQSAIGKLAPERLPMVIPGSAPGQEPLKMVPTGSNNGVYPGPQLRVREVTDMATLVRTQAGDYLPDEVSRG